MRHSETADCVSLTTTRKTTTMPLHFITTAKDEEIVIAADKYTVDAQGVLHVYDVSASRGTFAAGHWAHIVAQEDPPASSSSSAVMAERAVGSSGD